MLNHSKQLCRSESLSVVLKMFRSQNMFSTMDSDMECCGIPLNFNISYPPFKDTLFTSFVIYTNKASTAN